MRIAGEATYKSIGQANSGLWKSAQAVLGRDEAFSIVLIVVTLVELSMRINHWSFVAESLWYEDGWVFINESHRFGLSSLFIPHSGYQYLYNRLVALLASQMPLELTPCIFFAAWLLSFFSIVWVLRTRGRFAGLDELMIACLISAIALQPSHGEPFFNLDHAHFFLGIALALYVCIPSNKPASIGQSAFLVIASLTGPHSSFLIATLALQLLVLRDFSQRRATYLIVTTAGLIQGIFIFLSHRVSAARNTESMAYWLDVTKALIFFGKEDKFTYIVAALFWSITLVALGTWIVTTRSKSDRALRLSPLFAAATAILMFCAGAWGSNYYAWPSPYNAISPIGMGSRYFLFAYSLFFFIAITCTGGHRRVQLTVISLMSMICAAGFLSVDRTNRGSFTGLLSHADMQWVAFAKFQKIRRDLIIPINAPNPIYPPSPFVQIETSGVSREERVKSKWLVLLPAPPSDYISAGNLAAADTEPGISSKSAGLAKYYDIGNLCPASEYLALEIDVWRSRMGMARVSWGTAGARSWRSQVRFYPAGAALMQFAFHRNLFDTFIRLDPAEGVVESPVVRTLGILSKAGLPPHMTVAEPTEPGGDIRINEVRLFCLE